MTDERIPIQTVQRKCKGVGKWEGVAKGRTDLAAISFIPNRE
jgi:hypothetical protein